MSLAILASPSVFWVPRLSRLDKRFEFGVDALERTTGEIVLFGPVRASLVGFHDIRESRKEFLVRDGETVGSGM